MLLFVHMPKTGGKALKESLNEAYGTSLKLYYRNPMKMREFKRPSLLKQWAKFLGSSLSNSTVVFGHFCLDDFTSFRVPKHRRAVFFRDPVEWAGSYWFYGRQKFPEHLTGDPLDDIKRLGLDDAYSRFLGRTEVSDLDFVGLVERYSDSLDLYGKIFGPVLTEHVTNRTEGAPKSYRDWFSKEGVL